MTDKAVNTPNSSDLLSEIQLIEDLYADGRHAGCIMAAGCLAEHALQQLLGVSEGRISDLIRRPELAGRIDSRTREAFRQIDSLSEALLHPKEGDAKPDDRFLVRSRFDSAYALSACRRIISSLFAEPKAAGKTEADAGVNASSDPLPADGPVFDAVQESVIELSRGKHIVLAPPGTGKTAILAERMARAAEKGVPMEDMVCLTFTNRAARGMKDRLTGRFGTGEAGGCFVGSLHRFCSKLLFEGHLVSASTEILDERDTVLAVISLLEQGLPAGDDGRRMRISIPTSDDAVKAIVRHITATADRHYQEEHGFPPSIWVPPPERLDMRSDKTAEALMQCGLLIDQDGEPVFSVSEGPYTFTDVNELRIRETADRFNRWKKERHLLTFNDLLFKVWEALKTGDSRIRRYPWVQVDEVHDLTPLQINIIARLWDDRQDGSVCVLFGDEQQAIFSSEGAKLSTLTAMQAKCELHRLEKNYRSPKYLLDLFNDFAEYELCCSRSVLPEASREVPKPEGALRLVGLETEEEVREAAAEELTKMPQEETCAVIVSSDRTAEEYGRVLDEKGIPHFRISGTDVFQLNILKTARAWLSVLREDFRPLPWAQLYYRVAHRDAVRERIYRELVLERLPYYGLLASDLLLYTGEDGIGGYVDDFAKAFDEEIVVFDTETTGLEVGKDDVIQIAAARVRAGAVTEKLVLYLKTDRPIPKMLGRRPNPMADVYEATKAEHLDPEEGIRRFLAFTGDSPVLGHNVAFDCAMIESQLRRITGGRTGGAQGDETLFPMRFDTLKLSHAMSVSLCRAAGCTSVRSHGLKSLIELLGLEGLNSHKADDDVEATVNLMTWFRAHADDLKEKRLGYRANPKIQAFSEELRKTYLDIYLRHRALTAVPTSPDEEAVTATVMREFIECLPTYSLLDRDVKPIRKKLPLIYRYLDRVLINKKEHSTLYAQLHAYLVQINTLKEPDLCSPEVIDEHLFISTEPKSKGLEFDKVIIPDAAEGVYPFFGSRTEEPRREDARRLYVALSRARKAITVYWANTSSRSTKPRALSPFIRAVKEHFE